MTTMRIKVLLLLVSYLSGSVPFGLLYSRFLEREDVRKKGSGNIGATNIIRNFGWSPGLLVLLLDALKGAFPVYLTVQLFPEDPLIWILVGGVAIGGHVFSVFLYFDGGKGVATSAGVFAVLMPQALLVTLAIFGLVVGTTRYMSAGSLTAALVLPLTGGYLHGFDHPVVIGAGILAAVVYWQHRENIKRLARGEEETFF
jgi:glycerol-3-phosphate acyltransferase PlsY